MSCITVKFFDKEYSIPNDVVTYVDLIDFTNGIRDSLMSSFKRQIRPSVDVIESDTFMVSALNDQASKFISKLLENDIYDRTANDYLQNNKGYELFLDTKKKVVNQLISIRTEKLNTYRTGVEDAIYRKESSVTGLDFGIITGSFVNSMIYAYMDASEHTKQEKEALRVYNQEIAELNKQVAAYDRQESDYIIGNVIPAMNTVFTFFAYELLDKFIADLIRYNKFDKEALKFINLERSNDLLKNLSLAGNKKAVIESAFVACPFNANVYSQATNYGLIDYDTYLTAHHFKQDENILNTLTEKLGEVTYPDKFRINYVAAEQLAKCTGRDVKFILQEKTKYYANAVFKSYKDVANILNDKDFAVKTIYEFPESAILAGDAISKGQASFVVEKLVKQNIWLELVDKCGHSNLIDDIKKLIPEANNVFTKKEVDEILKGKLYILFEEARKNVITQIEEKWLATEQQKEFDEAQKLKNKKYTKYGIIIGVFTLVIIIILASIGTHKSTISNIDYFIENEQYEHAFDSVNDSKLSDEEKAKYRNTVIPFMQDKISENLKEYQVINVDGYRVYLGNNRIFYRNNDDELLLEYTGRGKILDDLMYTNGYIIFVEAFDSWGYDVNFISISSGKVTTIETFDEFDKFFKLEDGTIFIKAVDSDGMYLIFNPYTLEVVQVSRHSSKLDQRKIYDSENY